MLQTTIAFEREYQMLRFGLGLIIAASTFAGSLAVAAARAEVTKPGEFRATVALVYRLPGHEEGEIYCSGTLVGRGTVLTAAHCLNAGAQFFKVPLPEFMRRTAIYIGDSPAEGKLPTVKAQVAISGAVIHPDYHESFHDLAVLTFRPDMVPQGTLLEPAVVLKDARIPDGTPVTSVGFGKTDEASPKGHKTQFVLPARHLTNEWFNLGQKDSENPTICHGDSGGSAYARTKKGQLVLVGVATSTSGCGRGLSYYQSVTPEVAKWIHSADGDLSTAN